MKIETFIDIEDLKLEFIKEGMASLGYLERKYAIILRVTNQSDKRKFVSFSPEYISVSKGLIDSYSVDMSHYMYSGQELLPKSFVDVKISFEGIKRSTVSDGDRVKLKISNFASVLLRRENSQWYFVEFSLVKKCNDEIKAKIEQLETIEENLGIAFTNFTVQIKDYHSFKLFIEVMITDKERCKEFLKIPLQLVVYDNDNNVIYMQEITFYNNSYTFFHVLDVSVDMAETTLSDINKIRIFPSL